MDKKFNNTPNEHVQFRYQSNHGTTAVDYWISRSVAVVGVVFAIPMIGETQVLITKRSPHMLDEKNKYGVPCGYLDWDETTHQAMMREVYEETSLYLPDYDDLVKFNNGGKPIYIKDEPSANRQNVSFIFVTVLDFSKSMNRFPLDIRNYTNKETALVKWMSMLDFTLIQTDMQWAFNHNETIKSAYEFINKKP